MSYFVITKYGFIVLGDSLEKIKDMLKGELSVKSSQMTLATYLKLQRDIDGVESLEDLQILSYLISKEEEKTL